MTRTRQEEEYLARLRHEVPSPDEMDAALARVQKAASITFNLELNSWRTIVLTDMKPMPNRVVPELTVLFAKPVLVIPTPYMPVIDGWLALTLETFGTRRATMLFGAEAPVHATHTKVVGFQTNSDAAADWLRLQFARAMGMKFRSHSFLDPSKVVYTRDA